jgi:ABC-2 type transport system ATP-binding protein
MAAETALDLQDLRKRYGDTVALDGVSFGVGGGEMFGFVGPNGAGKTTLMRIVLGVLASDAGRVLWRGAPIGPEERRRIGYMPEERGLYPKMRVRDHVVYVARLHGVEEAQAEASTDRWLGRLGIAERADDAVEALSLGNQQRVQLGVALVHEPDLLVLDEPFSGLDPEGVDALSGALQEEIDARGVPVIFSSHQLDLVERLCDSVAIIRSGRIVAEGRLDEIEGSLADLFRESTQKSGGGESAGEPDRGDGR